MACEARPARLPSTHVSSHWSSLQVHSARKTCPIQPPSTHVGSPLSPLQVYLARKAPARLDSSAYVGQAPLPDGASGMSSVMERRYVIKKMDRQQADPAEVGLPPRGAFARSQSLC
eukprot:1161392-Pelagomonas_calceolata.AAC.22